MGHICSTLVAAADFYVQCYMAVQDAQQVQVQAITVRTVTSASRGGDKLRRVRRWLSR